MDMLAFDLGKYNSMTCFFDANTNQYRFQLVIMVQVGLIAKQAIEK